MDTRLRPFYYFQQGEKFGWKKDLSEEVRRRTKEKVIADLVNDSVNASEGSQMMRLSRLLRIWSQREKTN